MPENSITHIDIDELNTKAISAPLIRDIYTADPSAHVFNGKIYIYPSHDIENDIPFDDLGSHFAMEDYHVISMESPNGQATLHAMSLHVKDVPWAHKQMWAPDAAFKNGTYFLYFPAKNIDGFFQIGVAVSNDPAGPFKAMPLPIKNSYSIDPAVFTDDDHTSYIYFGGLWGGQLQCYRDNVFHEQFVEPLPHEKALGPRIAKLTEDMLEFSEEVREVTIVDDEGNPLKAGDHDRRFFEASWLHKYNGKYYFSYSTGNTHFICYAIGDNPYGPFTYRGKIMNPVLGWTTHHSICEFQHKWYIFYHDSSLSSGVTHLRSIKVHEINYDENGDIATLNPYGDLQVIS